MRKLCTKQFFLGSFLTVFFFAGGLFIFDAQAGISLAEKLKGYILLRVEHKGEAWYVNPNDGKRYFLGKPQDAFDVMKKMGLGVSDQNLTQIPLAEGYSDELASSWKKFFGIPKGETVGFKVDYSSTADYAVNEQPDFYQVIFKKNDSSFFEVQIKDQLDTNAYLDHNPVGNELIGPDIVKKYNGYSAYRYELKNGYCDAEDCTSPLIAYRVDQYGKSFIIVFYNTISISEEMRKILSSFDFYLKDAIGDPVLLQ